MSITLNNITAVNSDCFFPKFNVDSNATVFVIIKNLRGLICAQYKLFVSNKIQLRGCIVYFLKIIHIFLLLNVRENFVNCKKNFSRFQRWRVHFTILI